MEGEVRGEFCCVVVFRVGKGEEGYRMVDLFYFNIRYFGSSGFLESLRVSFRGRGI